MLVGKWINCSCLVLLIVCDIISIVVWLVWPILLCSCVEV
jgi:hypothetical protein